MPLSGKSVGGALEEVGCHRVVDECVDLRRGERGELVGGHGGEAHRRRPGDHQRFERIEHALRPDEVHVEDAARVAHGRRDPGRMGQGTKGAELAYLFGQSGHGVGIGHVTGQTDGALDGRCLQVDDHEVVGHAAQPVHTAPAHAAGRSGDDGDAHGADPVAAVVPTAIVQEWRDARHVGQRSRRRPLRRGDSRAGADTRAPPASHGGVRSCRNWVWVQRPSTPA